MSGFYRSGVSLRERDSKGLSVYTSTAVSQSSSHASGTGDFLLMEGCRGSKRGLRRERRAQATNWEPEKG